MDEILNLYSIKVVDVKMSLVIVLLIWLVVFCVMVMFVDYGLFEILLIVG